MDVTACPVCGAAVTDVGALAGHLVALSEDSDARHIMWLNRNVTKRRTSSANLEPLLVTRLAGERPPAPQVRR